MQLENYNLINAVINTNYKDKLLKEYRICIYGFNKNFVIIINNLLMYKGRFAIPNINNLRIYIINTIYLIFIIVYLNYNKIRAIL